MNQSAHSARLLADIEDFLRITGMGSSYFGKLAVGNSELVKRLRAGREVLPRTEEKVRAFMGTSIAPATERGS